VFMSGGTFTPGAREFLDTIPNARVDKPIDASRLRGLIEASTR
jgi:two-component system, cell cycle sensor histidine kinase and response regulator CckA